MTSFRPLTDPPLTMPASARVRAFSVAILAAAVLNLRAVFAGNAPQEYLFKPLTTILIALLAATSGGAAQPGYRPRVVAGLALSLAGDVFLMLPGNYFIPGLASFLLAHVCYVAAFTRGGWRAAPGPAASCGAYLMVLLWIVLPAAGDVRIPVAIYGTVICTMAWQALERWRVLATPAAAFAAAGAVLFVVSDTALAINRFVSPFHLSPLAVMGTYVPAQWLIALSVAGSDRGRASA